MGLLLRKDDQGDTGGFEETIRAVATFDAVYATGGVPVDVSEVPFRVKTRLDSLEFDSHPTFAFEFERTNVRSGNLVIYNAVGGLSEVANGTDLSAVSVGVTAKGR